MPGILFNIAWPYKSPADNLTCPTNSTHTYPHKIPLHGQLDKGFLNLLAAIEAFIPTGFAATACPGGFSACKVASLVGDVDSLLVILPSEDACFTDTLRTYLPESIILNFPEWDTLLHEQISPSPERVSARMEALHKISLFRKNNKRAKNAQTSKTLHDIGILEDNLPTIHQKLVVVASIKAFMQPIISDGNPPCLYFHTGGEYELSEIANILVAMSYSRTDLVGARGEFAIRGGILDIYPPTEKHPIRIEFFGRQLESMRHFRVSDQRSIGPYVSNNAHVGMFAQYQDNSVCKCNVSLSSNPHRCASHLSINNTYKPSAVMAPASEALIVYPTSEFPEEDQINNITPKSLLHFMPGKSTVVVIKCEQLTSKIEQLINTNREFSEAFCTPDAFSATNKYARNNHDGDNTLDGIAEKINYYTLEGLRHFAADLGIGWTDLSGFNSEDEKSLITANPDFSGYSVFDHIRNLQKSGWQIVLASTNNRVYPTLDEYGIDYLILSANTDYSSFEECRECSTRQESPQVMCTPSITQSCTHDRTGAQQKSYISDLFFKQADPDAVDSGLIKHRVVVIDSYIQEGFSVPTKSFTLIGEHELFGKTTLQKAPRISRRAIDPINLAIDDYVVHEIHGIARFKGMCSRRPKHDAPEQEYLILEYAKNRLGVADKLYIPTDQLSMISKYIGSDRPTLSRIGGSDWALTKSRARKAISSIALDLVKLYSRRSITKGYAFSPDTPFQTHFENEFLYTETRDQEKTIVAVKADMENSKPMDRIISGDVGFGKTEIAMRAAFKAVQDNKQVAVLVPTTLLARQHIQTFCERFDKWPVTIASLSRFQSKSEIQKTICGISSGGIDIVIGTHMLLNKKIQFKDLGLLIIDEEHRFGVNHKEAIKKLKIGIDILAMSATPIPRTLEMSLMGIKEISTLSTPPENRMPILTHVGPYRDKQVIAAVRREIIRGGQVFYIHNDTATISRVAQRLEQLIPEARVVSAHAKLAERMLEKTVIDFWEGKYDILVCTTIIETGLDNANANTIIIDSAENYGLSQLHQLRGRVGRGTKRAYAYLFYTSTLKDTAYKRLEAIARNNHLGAGAQIAMKDLELRGAGSLLGHAQSGHIASVGFDLYIRMVTDAISNFKGEQSRTNNLRLEIPVDASIPKAYVDSERLRIELYKKISEALSDADIKDIGDEILDRFGNLPSQVINLLELARLRILASSRGIDLITLKSDFRQGGDVVTVSPVSFSDTAHQNLLRDGQFSFICYRNSKLSACINRSSSEHSGYSEHSRQIINSIRHFIITSCN